MKKLLFILISALIITGCTRTPAPTPTPDPDPTPEEYNVVDYFPFLENTHLSFDGYGSEYADREVYYDFIDGNYIQIRVSNAGTTTAQIYEVTESEVRFLTSYEEIYFSYNFIDEVKDNEIEGEVLLMMPLEEGNKWTLPDGREREITGVAVEVETPYENFEAIEVTTYGEGGARSINYYALGIGLIKNAYIDGDFEVVSILERVETDTPLEQQVRIYYPDFMEEQIVYIEEEIELYTNDDIKDILEGYLKDSPSEEVRFVMGENARINEINFDRDEWAVRVDFNRAFITEMQAGVALESMILTTVGNIFGDYYNVDRVFITIDGSHYESGHILLEEDEFLSPQLEEAVPYRGQ